MVAVLKTAGRKPIQVQILASALNNNGRPGFPYPPAIFLLLTDLVPLMNDGWRAALKAAGIPMPGRTLWQAVQAQPNAVPGSQVLAIILVGDVAYLVSEWLPEHQVLGYMSTPKKLKEFRAVVWVEPFRPD